MRTITAIGGVPSSGKTSLVRQYLAMTDGWKPYTHHSIPHLYNSFLGSYVLGIYDKKELFSGTDKLSFCIAPYALEFIKRTKGNLIFEGDRLFNSSFLEALQSLPNTNLRILILSAEEETLRHRAMTRGSDQSPTFLLGRKTKIENIKSNQTLSDCVRLAKNESRSDADKNLRWIVS
jgi:hypothetical protein